MLGAGLEAGEWSAEAPAGGEAGRRVGDYELLGEIARGGMGVVFRARQLSLGRVVAVKMILRGEFAGPEELARFRQEAEAAAHLKHPNIVAIHEVGESEGRHFFSMDLIEGASLSALTREGPVPAARAARIVEKIARAVHHAHEKGVLHRDLKPSNVLVDGDDEPHVTDFGLAKRLRDAELGSRSQDLTLSGQIMGTPAFMPPEQAAGQRGAVGPASDVYALGAILYQLLAGRPPFVGADVHAVVEQVLRGEAIAPRLLNPGIPHDLETMVLKCLEKEPEQRYASALALAEDLGRFLNHKPILAQPPSATYRARKFVRRHRVGVAVAASVAAVLIAATAVSLSYAMKANREREASIKAQGEARDHAETVEAVLTFFKGTVLSAARPVGTGGGLGPDVTLREAVDSAEKEVSAQFGNRPLVEASIRSSLGTTYGELGDYALALKQLETAVDLNRKHGEPHRSDVLRILGTYGVTLIRAGEENLATNILMEVLRGYQASVGERSRKYLLTLGDLAAAYQHLTLFDEARRIDERVAKDLAEIFGPHDRDALAAKGNLAEIYSAMGDYAQSLALLEKLYVEHEAAFGPTNLLTLHVMNNLGVGLMRANRWQSAVRLQREALQRYRALLPADHPAIQKALGNLVKTLAETGEYDEALRMIDEALARAAANRSPSRLTTVLLRIKGNTLRKAGRLAEAVAVAEDVLARVKASRTANELELSKSLNSLGVAYITAGAPAKAVQPLQQAYAIDSKKYQPDHPELQTSIENLATALQETGQTNEAARLRLKLSQRLDKNSGGPESGSANAAPDESSRPENTSKTLGQLEAELQVQRVKLATDHPDLLAAMLRLATAYRETNRWAEAETLVAEVLATQRKNNRPGTRTLAETLGMLGETQLAQGKFSEAEASLRVAYGDFAKNEPGRSTTLVLQSLLGAAVHGQKRHAEAAELLVSAAEGLQKRATSNPHPTRTNSFRNAATRLIKLYDDWGKPDEAAKWRERIR